MTKIDVISGFLGAGKTTFIKYLIQNALGNEKVVIIENEFGEIGIDGGFLRESGIAMKEMNSGCICCSLVGDFGRALSEVIETYKPERIIIEPSGVGKLSDVIKAIEGVQEKVDITISSVVTVVDVSKCKMYLKNFGEFFSNQVIHANTIFLSRTDKADKGKIEKVLELLRTYNAQGTIITTPVEALSGEKLLEALQNSRSLQEELLEEVKAEHSVHEHSHEEGCGCGGHEHSHKKSCDCGGHEHSHEEGCGCGGHEHSHEKDCDCGGHEHSHEEGCGCGGHEHSHEKDCDCGGHEHSHEEGCDCGGHEHSHEEGCGCVEHGHEHSHEEGCSCGGHEHSHEEGCDCVEHGHEHSHHHADEVFTSWGVETPAVYSKEMIENSLKQLENDKIYGFVLRAKGMLPTEEGWIHFDYVPGEIQVRTGSADIIGKICVIGSKLNEKTLEELFCQQI